MTFWTLIRRSLRFHARSHIGVVIGAAIGSAALIGALVVGDSVRHSLTDRALARLGSIHFALGTRDRFFQSSLADRLAIAQSSGSPATYAIGVNLAQGSFKPMCSALNLPGVVSARNGAARANRVNVLGVDPVNWPAMAGWHGHLDRASIGRIEPPVGNETLQEWRAGRSALINDTLSEQLAVRTGDEILIRIRKPSALGMDVSLSPRDQDSVALRLKVGAVLPSTLLGDFGLSSQALPPNNLFLPLDLLGRTVGAEGGANILTVGSALTSQNPANGPVAKYKRQLAAWLVRRSFLRMRQGQSSRGVTYFVRDSDDLFFRLARILEPDIPLRSIPDEQSVVWLDVQLQRIWKPEDAGLWIHSIEQPQTATGGEFVRPSVEISSPRIFLESPVISAALTPRTNVVKDHFGFQNDTTNDVSFYQFVTNATSVLTYLANLITAGDNATPYSMVTAANGPFVSPDMHDDEILVNDWLADDLKVKPGDTLHLTYYAVDSGSKLIERTNSFRVRGAVPLRGIYADRTLMPDFPGVAKAETTHDWDTGFPLVYKIREKDEQYWRRYRGTPKAFITLAAGQAMWESRFGALTAIRYEVPTNSFASTYREAVYRNLLANLKPAEVGLRFQPVRQEALKSVDQAQDFGQLFLGFSLFLVVSALLLMALLFQFSLEQRASEIGILLSLGFTPRKVRRLLLFEGVVLAVIGGVLGASGGLLYAKAMLWALNTVWHSAVAGTELSFYATLPTLVLGLCASAIVAVITIWVTLRRQARQPARELLTGEMRSARLRRRSRGVWIALGSGALALGIIGWALATRNMANAEAFFGAGSLLLIAGLALAAAWLTHPQKLAEVMEPTLATLGIRGASRRRNRSLATIALLACGCFVIVAIGVFRLDANQDATRRASGTGGFALLGESTLPIVQDLNSQSGREFFGLSSNDLAGVQVVSFRVHDGDEASCLNLSRAQNPRVLGVKPELLASRFTFTDVAEGYGPKKGWAILGQGGSARAEEESGARPPVIPAVADANSIEWALGKKLGDTLDYTDEHGRAFKLQLVGALANSLLQGSILIDEAEFVKMYPSESGYRMFLFDAPASRIGQLSATLSRSLQDYGLELTSAAQRLNAFNAVQNTYLGTFQILGGLGLLLGSAGLGVVVLRNVLERRGELGLLLALGFRSGELQRLVLTEHGALLAVGLGLGLVAAAIAVLPALLSPATQLPYRSLFLTLAAVALNGIGWTWAATRVALRGDLLRALRNE
jgi:ABC-type lipoprotein release transport system permease subunit